jgi:hypothetical protein
VNYAQYFAVNEYHWTQWVVFGGHAFVAFLFLAAGVRTLTGGGEAFGAGLQLTIALLIIGLGLVVARVIGDRE